MRIKRLEIDNFRSLRTCSINFADTTAILGENNCGKSTFLLAMDLFFASSPRISPRDFSGENTAEPIDITLHFGELTQYDKREFENNLLDGKLIVTRRFTLNGGVENGSYFVSARVNPDFSQCRNENGKSEKRKLYAEIRDKYGNPPELEKEKNADEVNGFLEAWEAAHPEALTVQRVKDFKGWTNVAAGKLKQKTSFVLIKAVEDAAEQIQDNKKSPVKTLIDEIGRQTIENNRDFIAFMQRANSEISRFTDPKNVPVLAEISGGLTAILNEYYRGAEIIATWEPITQIQPSFPTANIDVKSNDFTTTLANVGHGLQRAIILTVLQYMADYRAKQEATADTFDEPQSDLILAIEEPEIYQHPTKQRLFRTLLRQLSAGFSRNSGIRIQIIFVTHSPLMVAIEDCESIRLVRPTIVNGIRNVIVKELSLTACSTIAAETSGRSAAQAWSAAQFGAKLHVFNSRLAEGFFSRCIVLVEGVGDEAILNGWYKLKNRDPHAEGIVICQVDGKTKLDKPIIIFQQLNIPCYWIFDNDRISCSQEEGKAIRANKLLQRLAGIDVEACEDWPVGQFKSFACWDQKMEKYILQKVGIEAFQKGLKKFSEIYDITQDTCLKFPASASGLLQQFVSDGFKFPELERLIEQIDSLAE